jgi:hypothetical protein
MSTSSASAPSLPASAASSEAESPAIAAAVAPTAPDATAAAAATEPYYWEPGAQPPSPVKLVTHNLHWLTWQLLGGVEYVGEVFSDMFGLVNPRYEWAAQAEENRIVSGAG